MYKNNSFLGIIPARGNSKRLPHKNIIDLNGKPLIAWTIEAGKKSKYLDRISVSTDNENIITVSKQYGADAPFKRPQVLASDTADTFHVVKHAIEFYKSSLHMDYDFVVLLQPTSPLRTYNDIDNAIEYLHESNADAVISVCQSEHHPLWSNFLPDNLSMESFLNKELVNIRSQDLPMYYRINGAIYICKIDKLLEYKSFIFPKNIFAYIMPQQRSVDIDTKIDLALAEILMHENKEQ